MPNVGILTCLVGSEMLRDITARSTVDIAQFFKQRRGYVGCTVRHGVPRLDGYLSFAEGSVFHAGNKDSVPCGVQGHS